MAATDIHYEVTAWIADEIGKQAFGEDYAFAVTFGPAPIQTPQGTQVIPLWQMLITARNPLLGEGPLFHGPVPIGAPRPLEDEVRKQVSDGMRKLRDLAATKLAAGNGHAKASQAG